MRGLVSVLLVGVMALTACNDSSGPSGSSDDPRARVDASRSGVQTAMRDVATTASGLELTLPAATGSWSVCSSNPPRMKYAAGGTLDRTAEPAAATIAALTAALEDDGWSVEDSGTDPEAYAVLTRDAVRASLGESRRERGSVSVGVTGECVETGEDQDSLLQESDDVLS